MIQHDTLHMYLHHRRPRRIYIIIIFLLGVSCWWCTVSVFLLLYWWKSSFPTEQAHGKKGETFGFGEKNVRWWWKNGCCYCKMQWNWIFFCQIRLKLWEVTVTKEQNHNENIQTMIYRYICMYFSRREFSVFILFRLLSVGNEETSRILNVKWRNENTTGY